MGPQAHFANSSKCGVCRIASESGSSTAILGLVERETVLEASLFGQSRTIVTGPSFTSVTAMRAPNTPVSTGTPSAARALQNSS